MLPNYLNPVMHLTRLHVTPRPHPACLLVSSSRFLGLTRAANIPTRRLALIAAQAPAAVVCAAGAARGRTVAAASGRTRWLLGAARGPPLLHFWLTKAHGAFRLWLSEAHGTFRGPVRHAVLGEVELLGVAACLLQRSLVDAVVVVDEAAVSHMPAIGAVPLGRELVGVPGGSLLVTVFSAVSSSYFFSNDSPDKIDSQGRSQAHARVLRDEGEELLVAADRRVQESVDRVGVAPPGAVHLLCEPELSLDRRHHVEVGGREVLETGAVCLVGWIP